jgi:peptide/nickel transport system ATP-binding protein
MDPIVQVRDLHTRYSVRGSFLDRLRGRESGAVQAVDGVSFDLRQGEVLGIVGESGSGKSTLARTLLGLVDADEGSIKLEGREIAGLGEKQFRALRRELSIVFQDPHASLNPAMTIGASVGDPLRFHDMVESKEEAAKFVETALERVGLTPPQQFMDKYPNDLSGGQKQRAALARAIILGPRVLIADEPVSMLDMSVRAKILELMLTLKREFDLTYLYITHDLATAKFFCDRIAIMYLGRIVELGPSEQIYDDPKHPYTVALLKAIPEPDPSRAVPRDLPRGEIPDAVAPPLGCRFHPRCPRAFEVCGWESRDLRSMLEARWTELEEAEYERERAVVGDLAGVEEPGSEAIVPAASGHSGADVQEIIERLRSHDPDDPFWRGVAEVEARPGDVRIAFKERLVPRTLTVGETLVECHLHDPEALAQAEREPATPR